MAEANRIHIIDWAFKVLCALLFLNANGIIFLLFGVINVASPLIIICCMVLLYYGKYKYSYFSDISRVFTALLFLIMTIGTLAAIYNFGYTNFHFGFLKIAYREYITTFLVFIVFYLVIRKKSAEERFQLLQYIYYLFLAATAFGLLEPFIGLRSFYNTWLDDSRTLGLFANPNETGMQANFTLALGLGLYLKNRLPLLVALPASVIAFATSISTFSKMAILTSVVLLSFFIVYNLFRTFSLPKKQVKTYYRFLFIFLVLTVFVLIPSLVSYVEDMSHGQQRRLNSLLELVIEGKVNDETTSYRAETFHEAFELIKRKPLFGYGIHTFSMGGMFTHRTDIGVHNTYLKLLGETGIFTLILFLWFIILFYWNAIKYWKSEWSFLGLGVLLVFVTFSMSSHNLLNQKLTIALLSFLMAFYSPILKYEKDIATH